jgi:hypothetical protein
MRGLGKAVDVRGDGTRHYEERRQGGDGSKTYPALYINQCSTTDLYNICPVNSPKLLLTKLLLLTNAVNP